MYVKGVLDIAGVWYVRPFYFFHIDLVREELRARREMVYMEGKILFHLTSSYNYFLLPHHPAMCKRHGWNRELNRK